MGHKLQIDRKVASLEDFQNARRTPVPWLPGHKLGILQGLFLHHDAGRSRRDYAASNGISRRTVQRWIHQFNTGGLVRALEPVQHGPGRKRKVGLQEFRDRILPAAQQSLRESGQADTIKTLYHSAQRLGLFNASYATFRRRLRHTDGRYRRRRITPTIDELFFHQRTGRWPRRLKAYGRRQAKKERLYWQRYRESVRQETIGAGDQSSKPGIAHSAVR